MSPVRLNRAGAIAALLLTGTIALYAPASDARAVIEGVATIKDGDSLVINGQDVRLEGIDAPEWRQSCSKGDVPYSCGKRAKHALAQLVRGESVTCHTMKKDRYGRYLAHCYVGHVNINARMVEMGHALAYRRYSQHYVPQEDAARQQRRGIHAGHYQLPKLWRRQHPRR